MSAAGCGKSRLSRLTETYCDSAFCGSQVQSTHRRIGHRSARYSDHQIDHFGGCRIDHQICRRTYHRTYRHTYRHSVLYTDRRSRRRRPYGCRARGDATATWRATWCCNGCGGRPQDNVDSDGERVSMKRGGRRMLHIAVCGFGVFAPVQRIVTICRQHLPARSTHVVTLASAWGPTTI